MKAAALFHTFAAELAPRRPLTGAVKRLCALLGVSSLLLGCVSTVLIPPQETLAADRWFHVVPMESRPLGVPPGMATIPGSSGSMGATRALGVLNSIAILAQLPEASRRSDEVARSLQAQLDQPAPWIPTVILAEEVRNYLGEHGMRAVVAPQVRAMPGVTDRAATATMENWLGPTRAWYNDANPTNEYAALSADPSLYVVEIGMTNYELFGSSALLVQVVTKVIHPASGRVIGRSRAYDASNMPKLGSMEQAFAQDGAVFKQAFHQTGRDLTRRCLDELRLVPEPPGR